MPFARIAMIGHKSIGLEGPPTTTSATLLWEGLQPRRSRPSHRQSVTAATRPRPRATHPSR
ncbi:DUF6053 domain-containing protein [Lysobacter enzymogenes]|uniref:DUF6053 domain-containing protein n=1 Tax=Lysobacter enzymogenes TaxID=69 RepID=UPI003D18DF58